MNSFLDIFTYESLETIKTNRVFRNCILLKPLGEHQTGDKIPSITMFIDLHMWNEDGTDFDEAEFSL